ncbi:MAG TPA: hypothetical protein PKJ23_17570 [bacterium]|nr:hypothetical protein [bacterium]
MGQRCEVLGIDCDTPDDCLDCPRGVEPGQLAGAVELGAMLENMGIPLPEPSGDR